MAEQVENLGTDQLIDELRKDSGTYWNSEHVREALARLLQWKILVSRKLEDMR